MVGAVNIRLVSKEEGKKVIYQGDALSSNDFTIRVDLSDDLSDHSEIRLFLTADLNPVLKMMADKPIRQFLDILINEIEGFRDWHNIRV
jgi:carbon monoxide dehydrogenase subunit G